MCDGLYDMYTERYYNGECEMDWYHDPTRLFLVKHLGWSCEEPSWMCDGCVAKEHCKEYVEEEE